MYGGMPPLLLAVPTLLVVSREPACLVPGVECHRLSQEERAWHREWQRRLGCWFTALDMPTRTELLDNCLSAFSLHLVSQLDILLERPPRESSPPAEGCEWVRESAAKLRLPDFPEMNFRMFRLPPLPGKMPWDWDEWLTSSLSSLAQRNAQRDAASRVRPTRATFRPSGSGVAVIGACATIAVACLFWLALSLRNYYKRAGRLQVRTQNK